MEGTTDREIKVTLVMNEREARWLKAMTQNPITNCEPEKETDDCRDMRHSFFESIDLK